MSNTVTIVFRGLMVFHDDVDKKWMEIGILPAPGHFPRIMTIKNGVLFSVMPLQQEIEDRDRIWEFQPDGPIGGATRRQSGPDPINRLTHGAESDFRWIIDFENADFPFGDLTEKFDTSILEPLLFVPTGEFYTKLRSPKMNLLNNTAGTTKLFGPLAAVLGLDIPLEGNKVNLVEKKTGDTVFEFLVEPNTIYEFSNAPPDIAEHHHPEEEVQDHFEHYYKLFKDASGEPKFSFEEEGVFGPPGPNPLLCGVLFLGKRSTPLD